MPTRTQDNPNGYWEAGGGRGPYAPNQRLGCEPFESLALQTTGKTFVTAKQKTALVTTRVVFGNCSYRPGWRLHLRGDSMTLPWAREVFEIDGTKVIFVPEEAIQLVETGDDGR